MPFNAQALRQDRIKANLSQKDLAARAGIKYSSYLCQIERGKRQPSGEVLERIVKALKEALAEAGASKDFLDRIKPGRYLPAEKELVRLHKRVDEVLKSAEWKALELPEIKVPAEPEVQRAILQLYQHYRLSEEKSQGEGSYASAQPERGDTGAPSGVAARSEAEELNKVEQYQRDNSNYWPSIESYVTSHIHSRRDFASGRFRCLSSFVRERFGYTVTSGALPGLAWAIDVDNKKICLADSLLDIRRRIFHIGHAIGRICLNEDHREFEPDPLTFKSEKIPCGLSSDVNTRQNAFTFERQVQILLSNYFAGCVLLPRREFFEDADRLGYDVWKLARRWRVTEEQVMHRLSTMGDKSKSDMPEPIPFHFLRMNLAGGLLASWSGSGLHIPSRIYAPCVKWNAVSCFIESPHRMRAQRSLTPDGTSFVCVSSVVVRPDLVGEAAPLLAYSITLGCRAEEAHRLVYGRDMARMPVVKVGNGCQRCPRDCAHRGHVLLSRFYAQSPTADEDVVLEDRNVIVRKINILNTVTTEQYLVALKTLGKRA